MGNNQSASQNSQSVFQNTSQTTINNSKWITFEKSQFYKVNNFFDLNQSEAENKNNQEDFLSNLLKNPQKKVKLISIVGETGHGKSTLIELIVSIFLDKPYSLFERYSKSNEKTKGIKYLIIQLDSEYDLVFFDCEGFENSNDDEDSDDEQSKLYQEKLYLLIGQIARLSTLTLHVTTSPRLTQSFKKFLYAVDIEEKRKVDKNYLKKKGILSNFLELLNKQQDLDGTKQSQYPIFEKSYNIEQFKSYQNQIEISNSCFNKIKQIAQDIRTLKFKSNHDNTEIFQKYPTYKSMYEIFKASFDILYQRGVLEKKHFADITNLQLRLKNYVEQQIKILKEDHESQMRNNIANIIKNISSDNIISFFLLERIIQQQDIEAKNSLNAKIKELQSKWHDMFVENMNQILENHEFRQNDKTEIVSQYSSMNGVQPEEFLKLKIVRSILESTSTFGFILYIMIFPFVLIPYFVRKIFQRVQKNKLKQWKQNVKQNIKKNFQKLDLNINNNQRTIHNQRIFSHILQNTVSQNDFNRVTRLYTQSQIDNISTHFYFNIASKKLKKEKILKVIEIQNQLDYIIEQINNFIKGTNEQILKNIIQRILENEYTKQEKQNLFQLFDYKNLQFNDNKYKHEVFLILKQCVDSQENRSQLEKLISYLLMLKLDWPDIFIDLVFQIAFPKQLNENTILKDVKAIQIFFNFQQELLDISLQNGQLISSN